MNSIIFYTDNRIDFPAVKESILKSGLPIVSCSLKPASMGKNIVLDMRAGPVTMFTQILTALEASEGENVFFCEHDVIYHPSHFRFTPPEKDVFYYNTNVWRWDNRGDRVISYDHLRSVSGLCVNKKFAIDHYRKRLKIIYEKGYDKVPTNGNPGWARTMGYEPGKPIKNGGISDDRIDEWRSEFPNIDVRHSRTMTPIKTTYDSFIVKPTGWKESIINNFLDEKTISECRPTK
jgi:hypothetical protein